MKSAIVPVSFLGFRMMEMCMKATVFPRSKRRMTNGELSIINVCSIIHQRYSQHIKQTKSLGPSAVCNSQCRRLPLTPKMLLFLLLLYILQCSTIVSCNENLQAAVTDDMTERITKLLPLFQQPNWSACTAVLYGKHLRWEQWELIS